MEFPILNQDNFLSPNEFKLIQEICPQVGWQDAVVYDKKLEKEKISKSHRNAQKIHERRKEVILKLKKIILPKLLAWLKTFSNFKHIWFRYSHTQWILYSQGMFFSKHQDFEKYLCDYLTPYVALLGLENTEAGGETMIGETLCNGSCKQNGIVFFPGNIPHEAKMVKKGIKRCLKLEFFVLMDQNVTGVQDSLHQWKSFWCPEQLKLFDNYMSCHQNFSKQSNITVSTDMAQTIHNAMLAVADYKNQVPRDFEMIFPNYSPACIRDIFNSVYFMRHGKGCYIGTDPDAWMFLNKWSGLLPFSNLMVVLWARSPRESYEVEIVYHRDGNTVGEVQQVKNEYFTDFPTLKTNILQDFVNQKDLETFEKLDYHYEKVGVPGFTHWNSSSLENVYPSDEISKPEKRFGVAETSHFEMCNDEDGGHLEYERAYVSYNIQIRWVLTNSTS